MTITHDYSFAGGWRARMRDHGFAHDALDRLIFNFEYTEAQKAANRAYAESHTEPEWNRHCDEAKVRRSEAMRPVAEALAAELRCCQFDHEADESMPYEKYEWELFFHCNPLNMNADGFGCGARDYSYFTLTFNDHHTLSQQEDILRRAEAILERFSDNENLIVTGRHDIVLHESAIREEAARLRPLLDGKRDTYHGCAEGFWIGNAMEGRLKYHDGQLYFMRKHARTRGYLLSDPDVLLAAWELSAA